MKCTAETTKNERVEMLEKYFLENLVEDPINGTNFDCEILEYLKTLKEKYKNK